MEEWAILFKNRIIQRFSISEGQSLVIGRGRDADVIIHNTAVSRQHSALELKGGQYYLADLRSMNGTRVNGKKIRSAVPIRKSDELQVGKFDLKPARELSEEELQKPVASVARDYEDADMTRYVSGIYNKPDLGKKKVESKNRALTVLTGQVSPTTLVLKGKGIKAGKDPGCDLVLSGLFLGRIQFTIISRKEGYFIYHVGGLRTTRVNGVKLTKGWQLKALDVIQIGGIKIRFS